MKSLLRYFLINLVALWGTSQIIKGLVFLDGTLTLAMAALAFTIINFLLIPLLKILLLPLNLLTLGMFSWLTNVLALYALTRVITDFKLVPYSYPGWQANGFSVPAFDLTTFWVAVLASLLIGMITHFLHWLSH